MRKSLRSQEESRNRRRFKPGLSARRPSAKPAALSSKVELLNVKLMVQDKETLTLAIELQSSVDGVTFLSCLKEI